MNVSGTAESLTMSIIHVAPGIFHVHNMLSLDQQRRLVERCERFGREVGFYAPVVRGGGRRISLEMLCLGMHWNARTYTYEAARSDYDGTAVPPLPSDLAALARQAAARAGMTVEPQICLVNRYSRHSRLGLHQDKDERPEVIAAGIPLVTLSLGDSATFMCGGTRRRDPVLRLSLRSGDALVMGGDARLRYHGVAGIVPGSAPQELGIQGRYSLTFRQYALR